MQNPSKNHIYANALTLIPEIGPIRLAKLWAYFGNFETAWQASLREWERAGFEPKILERILPQRARINPDQSYEQSRQAGIEILLMSDPAYPPLLKEIPAPPPILYIRGNAEILKLPALAIVGTRTMTPYGKQAVTELVTGLASQNINIVSGLAFGVDAEALSAAHALGMQSTAVLASSIDDASISPRANFQLAQKILTTGCVVSEYPLGSQVQKQNFPVRNRIISGLSLGTVVIEADLESGALITAKYALDQNRAVLAVPGPIFSPASRGTNQLIKQGAKMVTSLTDIIQELNLDLIETAVPDTFNEDTGIEAMLLNRLTRQPTHVDDLVRTAKLPAQEINSALTMLEIKGRIKNLGNSRYVKIR